MMNGWRMAATASIAMMLGCGSQGDLDSTDSPPREEQRDPPCRWRRPLLVPEPSSVVTRVRFDIHTGGDDLRRDSRASAYVKLDVIAGILTEAGRDMNDRAEWPNWSWHTAFVDLPSGFDRSRIRGAGVRFNSGQPDVFSTGDNWNMQEIKITGIADDGTEMLLSEQAGDPLHRFQSDHFQDWFIGL